MLDDELIVCTRGRPKEVGRCLATVAAQSRMPRTVRIVDSSPDDDTRDVVRALMDDFGPGQLVYERSRPGLTTQRNRGLDSGDAAIVHFVDDDVLLDSDYVKGVMAVFARDTTDRVAGVGGLVTNVAVAQASFFRRAFCLYGNRPGSVLRSGRNVLAVEVDRELDVDWLSGCSMSIRRSTLGELRFDERLPGFGLGEDVELTYRLGQHYRLVVTPAARLEHLQSPINRLDAPRYTYDEICNRYRRVKARTGRLRPVAFWWSVLGQTIGLSASSVVGPDRIVARRRLSATVSAVAHVLAAAV